MIITQPFAKANANFTVPRRVGGWVDLGGWLRTEMVYWPADLLTYLPWGVRVLKGSPMTGADLHSAIIRQNVADLDSILETKYVDTMLTIYSTRWPKKLATVLTS